VILFVFSYSIVLLKTRDMKKHEAQVLDLVDWLKLRNYSPATMRAYGSALRQFLDWRQREGLGVVFSSEDARGYLLYRYDQGRRWQTINGDYSAMQKFYVHVLGKSWNVDHLPRPRKERSLPKVLSVQEVEGLINAGRTLKHQVFMALLYGTGLRLSEALNLKITHIEGARQQVRVVKGKGAKDRYVQLPDCLLLLLRSYFRAYRPEGYLFNGKYRSSRWANRSAQHAISQAREGAAITRPVSAHILRHCYATHHLEKGTNLVYLKEQMGHKNLKTTARYVHLCAKYHRQVGHPLGDLQLQLHTLAG
jgi:site-specific recombinase XerD